MPIDHPLLLPPLPYLSLLMRLELMSKMLRPYWQLSNIHRIGPECSSNLLPSQQSFCNPRIRNSRYNLTLADQCCKSTRCLDYSRIPDPVLNHDNHRLHHNARPLDRRDNQLRKGERSSKLYPSELRLARVGRTLFERVREKEVKKGQSMSARLICVNNAF